MNQKVTLDDKYDLSKERVFLSGTQALVRLCLAQVARDKAAGHRTAGYITGYRGSPLGGLDQTFGKAKKLLGKDIKFQPGLNEDLAATALWGSQRAALAGENLYDGVFGLWYGKGPGVDRSGDVLRHANLAGTAALGGVLALMGDDHTCESSTTAHQSEFGMINALIPILSPAGVQDIVDYGLLGIEMSRFSGLWVGFKLVKDTVESTASIDGRVDRLTINRPDFTFARPANIANHGFDALGEEALLHEVKLPAAEAFAVANNLNPIVYRGGPSPRIGLVGTGKSWLDLLEALSTLGIDEVAAANLGIRIMKVGMPWPLPRADVTAFADGLEKIIVIEEKRGLIEPQMKDILYGTVNAPKIIGKEDETGAPLFRATAALDAGHVAHEIGRRLKAMGADEVAGPLAELDSLAERKAATTDIAARRPWFCAGCPHSSSTVVPEGARAGAGIGCHFMAVWMDRNTVGYTQMGGEGAQWIGEAPFVTRPHMFQNLGDGTYNHSGSLALRAAVASGVNITYKILFNDAVAMTGGQTHDGGSLNPAAIAAQVRAEGVADVAVVTDEPERYEGLKIPASVDHRDDIIEVQKRLADIPGVTVMIYDQTCASEKRRRRKRGAFPDPDKRIVINERVCEGCGDCGVQSNCVAIQPVETAFGRKRQIDQSSCNKDFSCLKGFCPSFVTVHGAKLRATTVPEMPTDLPEPARAPLTEATGILVTGVGGTGVVTVGAVIGMAAHIEGLGAGIIDMAGLAQKGGAVLSHIKIAPNPDDITTIRVGAGDASAILGCDIAVAGSAKVLSAIAEGAKVVVNTHEQFPGDFTKNIDFTLPGRRIVTALEQRAQTIAFDATEAANTLFSDAIASNMMVMGAAYQAGALPLSAEALEEAIRLNGAAVPMNLAAFRAGRLSVADPARFAAFLADAAGTPMPHRVAPANAAERTERYAASLTQYQDAAYAQRFVDRVAAVRAAVERTGADPEPLVDMVARQLYKLMAIKDEYEVARLYTDGGFAEQLKHQFADFRSLEFHMAPPIMTRTDARTGRPEKRQFGPWMLKVLPLLAKMKRYRGTWLDLFGRTAERRAERDLLDRYETTVDLIADTLTEARLDAALALATWPDTVKGYGPVRAANMEKALKRLPELEAAYQDAATPARHAAE